MIDQILKDHKPGEKPRFFLHDEMKAWLGDHLKIDLEAGVNQSANYDLVNKLSLPSALTIGTWVRINVSLDGESIISQGININMLDHEKAFVTLSNVVETCMVKITQLQIANEELTRRIQLLETPLPV